MENWEKLAEHSRLMREKRQHKLGTPERIATNRKLAEIRAELFPDDRKHYESRAEYWRNRE